jgi:uncharacterized coiled-coil protein SlyX
MNPLKLVKDSDTQPKPPVKHNHRATDAPDSLPFPAEAVQKLNRQRIARLTTQVETSDSTLADLEAHIGTHLDRAQRLVNKLRQEVDNYKFPAQPEQGDNRPPPCAA